MADFEDSRCMGMVPMGFSKRFLDKLFFEHPGGLFDRVLIKLRKGRRFA